MFQKLSKCNIYHVVLEYNCYKKQQLILSPVIFTLEADAKEREKKEREKEEAEKTADEETNQTLEQQETMKISGSNARHMVMQKLMRQSQVI